MAGNSVFITNVSLREFVTMNENEIERLKKKLEHFLTFFEREREKKTSVNII